MTQKIILAYDYEDDKAEDTVTVEDDVAAMLLREGRARPTPQAKAAATRRTSGSTEES